MTYLLQRSVQGSTDVEVMTYCGLCGLRRLAVGEYELVPTTTGACPSNCQGRGPRVDWVFDE